MIAQQNGKSKKGTTDRVGRLDAVLLDDGTFAFDRFVLYLRLRTMERKDGLNEDSRN